MAQSVPEPHLTAWRAILNAHAAIVAREQQDKTELRNKVIALAEKAGVTVAELFLEPPQSVRDWISGPTSSPLSFAFGMLDRVLRKAERTHRALPRKHHPIWATEIGWSDVGPAGPQRVGSQGQATQVRNLR